MAKIDEIKEQIGWLKIVFGLLTAIDISLLGWLAQNYDSADIVLLSIAIILVVIVTSAIIYSNKKAYEKIKKIGDL